MSDSQILEIDFTGAPPAQGGGGSDYIKPGTYVMVVNSAKKTTSKGSGRPQAIVDLRVHNEGQFQGKKILDYFLLDRGEGEYGAFGLQRFHAFLVAVGYTIGERKVQLDLEQLAGRPVVVQIDDDTLPPNEKFPDGKIISKAKAYMSYEEVRAAQKRQQEAAAQVANGAAPAVLATPAAPAEAAEAAPVAAPKAASKVKAATSAPVAAPPAAALETPVASLEDVAADVDDIFSS